MKLSILTGSVSRQAGGTYDAIRRPASILAKDYETSIQVLGTFDEYAEKDMHGWAPLSPETFAVVGPRGFGFTNGMSSALRHFVPDLQHVHGIWMHYSWVNHHHHSQVKTPYVISPHGMLDPWALQNSAWKKKIIGSLFECRHLANAACLHALCEPEAQAIRTYGLKNPVCIIPNGIDLPVITKDLNPPWEERFAGRKVLLFLGRIHPKKGLPALLEAWHDIKKAGHSGAEWSLAIVGWDQDGHEATLKQFVEENSLQDSVVFLGPLFGEFKQAALTHADAFILPSHSEGLPMTVLEAWANKLPVLMTPQCNIPEGFSAGAALIIHPMAEGIATGLETLFSLSNAECTEMGECGFKLVQSKFTWEKLAEQFYAVYKWIVGGGNPPGCVHLL